ASVWIHATVSRGEWICDAWVSKMKPCAREMRTKCTTHGWIPADKDHRNEVEVTECSPPSRIRWETTEAQAQGRFVSTFVLTPEGSGTKLERTFEFPDPTGAIRLIFPVISAVIVKPNFNKGVSMLKQQLESGSAASAAT